MNDKSSIPLSDPEGGRRSAIDRWISGSIASKIFGLALFLLALTIALSIYLLAEVRRSETDIVLIARHDLPLLSAAEEVNEAGLRRRLGFARWFGALNRDTPNREIVAEARANYENFTPKLAEAFVRMRAIIDGYPAGHDRGVALAEIKAMLGQIEAAYPDITRRQLELIDLQMRGKHDEANLLLNVLNDRVRAVQDQRAKLISLVQEMSYVTAAAAESRQRRVIWLALAAAAATVAFGLIVAGWVTRRLTRPIRALTSAVGSVRTGNLDVQLALQSRDEIGVLADSLNYFVRELRAKEELRRTFGKYVDPRVLNHMLDVPGAQQGVGERRVMTVSFGDLVGFSQISEHLTPATMVRLLNRHFGLQSQCVQDELGIVDKYIGDAIMSFWGPPFVAPEEQAVRACAAALRQVESLEVVRGELSELTGLRRTRFDIDARIGISTGEVVVGNIGSESSRSYTVIGDTVNLASRIEGANRTYGTRILVDEATASAVRGRMETRELDTIAVKGRAAPARIFELLGASGSAGADMLRLRDQFEEALRCYRAQRWHDAAGAFRACLELRPDDRPSRVMLERAHALASLPPEGAWDGVWRLTEK